MNIVKYYAHLCVMPSFHLLIFDVKCCQTVEKGVVIWCLSVFFSFKYGKCPSFRICVKHQRSKKTGEKMKEKSTMEETERIIQEVELKLIKLHVLCTIWQFVVFSPIEKHTSGSRSYRLWL